MQQFLTYALLYPVTAICYYAMIVMPILHFVRVRRELKAQQGKPKGKR